MSREIEFAEVTKMEKETQVLFGNIFDKTVWSLNCDAAYIKQNYIYIFLQNQGSNTNIQSAFNSKFRHFIFSIYSIQGAAGVAFSRESCW